MRVGLFTTLYGKEKLDEVIRRACQKAFGQILLRIPGPLTPSPLAGEGWDGGESHGEGND